jgi:hypothetical protein
MFHGDDPALRGLLGRALGTARELGHPRVGSEHLLLALTDCGGQVATVLAWHGATQPALTAAARQVGEDGAGAASDRELLTAIGIDTGMPLWGAALTSTRPVRRLLPAPPFGVAAAHRRAQQTSPPFGRDAEAIYEASLRLALARRDRAHRPEHLALALVAVDPGAGWVLDQVGVARTALLADLAASFPLPRRNALLRVDRRLGGPRRRDALLRRYERATGRVSVARGALAGLVGG